MLAEFNLIKLTFGVYLAKWGYNVTKSDACSCCLPELERF